LFVVRELCEASAIAQVIHCEHALLESFVAFGVDIDCCQDIS